MQIAHQKRTSEARYTHPNGQLLAIIGKHSYFDFDVINFEWWGSDAQLRIGNYCSVAQGVRFLVAGEHRHDFVSTHPFGPGHPSTKGSIVVGHDCWLGLNALILSGVTIGTGAVVGAGAVVSRDVAPYAIVAGNPARLIRYRFAPAIIERLERVAWWLWPDEEVKNAIPYLCSEDIERFLAWAERRHSGK